MTIDDLAHEGEVRAAKVTVGMLALPCALIIYSGLVTMPREEPVRACYETVQYQR
jgi:hypothetical protein